MKYIVVGILNILSGLFVGFTFTIYIAGIVLAKGIWWKLASTFLVLPAFYFFAERIMQVMKWLP